MVGLSRWSKFTRHYLVTIVQFYNYYRHPSGKKKALDLFRNFFADDKFNPIELFWLIKKKGINLFLQTYYNHWYIQIQQLKCHSREIRIDINTETWNLSIICLMIF